MVLTATVQCYKTDTWTQSAHTYTPRIETQSAGAALYDLCFIDTSMHTHACTTSLCTHAHARCNPLNACHHPPMEGAMIKMISQTCTWKAEIRKIKRPAQGHPGYMQSQTRIRCLVAKAMTNLDSVLKSRDITLPTKVKPTINLKKN